MLCSTRAAQHVCCNFVMCYFLIVVYFLFERIHSNDESLLSYSSGFQNYRGLLNNCIVLLVSLDSILYSILFLCILNFGHDVGASCSLEFDCSIFCKLLFSKFNIAQYANGLTGGDSINLGLVCAVQ